MKKKTWKKLQIVVWIGGLVAIALLIFQIIRVILS